MFPLWIDWSWMQVWQLNWLNFGKSRQCKCQTFQLFYVLCNAKMKYSSNCRNMNCRGKMIMIIITIMIVISHIEFCYIYVIHLNYISRCLFHAPFIAQRSQSFSFLLSTLDDLFLTLKWDESKAKNARHTQYADLSPDMLIWEENKVIASVCFLLFYAHI